MMRDTVKRLLPVHIGRKLQRISVTVLLFFLACLVLLPLVLTITNSFMSEREISEAYEVRAVYPDAGGDAYRSGSFTGLKFIPDVVTLEQYYTVLIKRTRYLLMFWNSAGVVVPIVLGQLLIASMAAYAFSRISFRGRDKLFFLYIVVMLMPFQVTLVPNYIIADRLGLMDSYLSIILPGVCSTFGVFLLRQFMVSIPDAYCESARADGASHWQIFTGVILPMSKAGIASLAILVFIDNWNMVEQPLIFIKDNQKRLLSVFLSAVNTDERGIAFAASSIYMAPMLLVFLYGESYLVEGIQLSGLKC